MIESYNHNRRKFQFTNPDRVNVNNNIFTILVGKNGTGKSRLLSSIALEFINPADYRLFQKDSISNSSHKNYLQYSRRPSKVITVSTSPFDRFPIGRKTENIHEYSYLGLRDLSNHNFGLAYMSKIISSLIEAFIDDAGQIHDITNVLNHLGYKDIINIRLEPKLTSRLAHLLYESKNVVEEFDNILRSSRIGFTPSINRKYFYDEYGGLDVAKVEKLVYILEHHYNTHSRKHIHISIGIGGILSSDLFQISPSDLTFLIHSGVIRLREVNLEKIDSGASFSISDASSGEQAVILGFLGIASQIKDYSLICIDEPEICLHPEWQEKYITMLFNAFNRYKGCHFLIATHSPQIVSNLESKNCFILSMDTGSVINSELLINNSADFQLANVFNAPGFKNEYLSRIAFSIFTKVSSKKKFDEKDIKDYNILISQEKLLDKNDPVYDLVIALKEMHKDYARNK